MKLTFLISGDFNKVNIDKKFMSFGALKQVFKVPTKGENTLELIITYLHTGYHAPTTMSPLQVDEGKKGKDSDHNTVVFAPKTNQNFIQIPEKIKIKFRPLHEDKIKKFCYKFTVKRGYLDQVLLSKETLKISQNNISTFLYT